MDVQLAPSRRLASGIFGLAMIGFALENLIRLDGVPQLEPFPVWLGVRPIVAVLSAAVLIGGGSLINARRLASRAAVGLAARIAFGLSFVAFGASHFVYHEYVEVVIPAWIPAHAFFAYATGVAHIAAGLSILSRIWDRLAYTLLTVMFGSWVFIVHIPRVVAASGQWSEWTSLIVAIAMCGASGIFAVESTDVPLSS